MPEFDPKNAYAEQEEVYVSFGPMKSVYVGCA